MIKKVPKVRYTFLLTVFFILICIYIITILRLNISIVTRLMLLLFILIFITLGLTVIITLRKKTTELSDELGICLDQMIKGEEEIPYILSEETLTSKLHVKLKRLYEIINNQNKRSREEKEAIQSLVSDISHQVKTPIANIKMIHGILQDRPLTQEQLNNFLQAMSMQIDKLDFLLQSMIKMSRLETGVFTMQPQQSSIYTTIAQALSDAKVQADSKNIHIIVQCDETLQVTHDGKWTVEALFNILDNAIKYTPVGGQVKISVSRWEIYTKIDIADTGRGIPEKEHGAIFQRFFREPDVHNQDGIGIGLYLARQIITLQGGYIEVKSISNQGAVFSIFIPN